MHGFNPGQFQNQNRPPPPGGMPPNPNQPMAPGVGFNPPSTMPIGQQPPPPGGRPMAPGVGFAPPPPGAGFAPPGAGRPAPPMNAPPPPGGPPGGMQNLNAGMGRMNINTNQP